MLGVGDDTASLVDMRRFHACFAKRFLHQLAGEYFAKSKQEVLAFQVNFASSLQLQQQRLQGAEVRSQLAVEGPVSGVAHQRIRQPFVAHIDVAHRRERRSQTPAAGGTPCLEKLIRDAGQRTDYDHWLNIATALDDGNEAANRGLVLYRSASELHHHYLVVSIESALSLAHRIRLHFQIIGAKKNPPPDRFWRWVRVILLFSAYFIRSRPPEDT